MDIGLWRTRKKTITIKLNNEKKKKEKREGRSGGGSGRKRGATVAKKAEILSRESVTAIFGGSGVVKINDF